MLNALTRLPEVVARAALLYAWLATPAYCDPLHILLTNDDGIDSIGLTSLETALRADGHRVTVIAPAEQQSGSGASISTHGPIVIDQRDASHFAIGGEPADAVLIGLRHVLRDDPPDLVVSGANFGQNLGLDTNISGTVGAVIMALRESVPGIAISVGLDLAERNAEPRFPSTLATFPQAAAFTAALIKSLSSRSRSLLPRGTALNINVPATPTPKGSRWAALSNRAGWSSDYAADGEGSVDPRLMFSAQGAAPGSDLDLFTQGWITISPIDGLHTAEGAMMELSKLPLPEAH
ncbi:MAG: 5'/3'-nucleotidase SurE [Pseudomonadota bacterium]